MKKRAQNLLDIELGPHQVPEELECVNKVLTDELASAFKLALSKISQQNPFIQKPPDAFGLLTPADEHLQVFCPLQDRAR